MRDRTVSKIFSSIATLEGAGFLVHRPFPSRDLMDFDPFLLLDEMGPANLGPGEAKGAPDHPHRGFETVTYMLDGAMEHKDSKGNRGRIGPGDVQWMTAGAGVIHSEMPEKEFERTGGRMHGFQLWVNLPRDHKMISPRYQEIPSSKIPLGQSSDGKVRVRVIAGESLGARAVIETQTPILYLHFTLESGAQFTQEVAESYNLFAYVVNGEGQFGPDNRRAERGQIVLFNSDGGQVQIKATGKEKLELLLIGGTPINEPVVRYGPFVMNTEEEIYTAINDYRTGKLGSINF